MMLWACTIEPGKDKNGKVIPIDVDGCIEDGLVVWVSSRIHYCTLTELLAPSCPIPFKINVSARFPEAAALLAGESEFHRH